MDKETKMMLTLVVIAAIVVAGVLGSTYLNNAQQVAIQEKQQENTVQEKIEDDIEEDIEATEKEECLDEAFEQYKKEWKRESESLGRTDNKLPLEHVKIHEQRYRDAKAEC